MPSVGPELPPHLAKRKRSIDEDDHPKSPPRKVLAATAPAPRTAGPTLPPSNNPDELSIDDSSDDGYGPSLGPSKPATTKKLSPPAKRVLGPAPPPQATTTNPDELNVDDDSSEDDYGPSIPKPSVTAPTKRILGPAPPPAPLSERPSHPANANDTSSDSEDDYGPSLPPAPGSAAETALLLQRKAEEETARLSLTSTTAPKPQRDDWMLVPPSDSDWSTRVDPTKLKNRKFASGKGSKAPIEKTGVSSIWTETPEQKRLRLADEVLGRASSSSQNGVQASNSKSSSNQEELATEARIRAYNEKNRGKSLLEVRKEAQEKGKMEKEEEDDPSKRGFDREKDMALGGRMGHGKKKEMLERAADFGTRFQRGKYL